MPTAYVKKVAGKHKRSTKSVEKDWSAAKQAAKAQGHGSNYAYVTSIFKKMVHENMKPTFKNFLIMESDIESVPGQSVTDEITPDQEADGLADMDPNHEANAQPVDLDNDERFLDLPPAEQMRMRAFARNMSPPEVEDELQQTWERVSGGHDMMDPTDADDMGMGDEESMDNMGDEGERVDTLGGQVADPVTSMPKPMGPTAPMGESLLSYLLKL